MRFLILPSPLLGPATYRPLAGELSADASSAEVAEVLGQTVDSVLDGFVAQAAGFDVLVPHSNAGRFAPAVAEAAGADIVYVDALLAEPDEDEAFTGFLRNLADDDGILPGWTDWWPTEEIDTVLGNWRPVVEAEQGRWPLEFLLTEPPAPDKWLLHTSGYLSFGTTYDVQASLAAAYGWPSMLLDGHHLHHLTDTTGVARAIAELSGRLPR